MNETKLPLPPMDLAAERALLASMIRDDGCVPRVRTVVGPEAFFLPEHRVLFEAVLDVHEHHGAVDGVLLRDALASGGRLANVGGVAGIADMISGLLEDISTAATDGEHALHFARQVMAKARKRRVWEAADEYRRALHGGDVEGRRDAFDRLVLAEAQAEGDGDGPLDVVRLADVRPQPLDWLWPGRIPVGKLTLLAGDPCLGKSLLSLDIAARVSRGTPWPDTPGTPNTAGAVVLLGAEDDVADTIRPRLDAAGADSQRIVAIQSVRANGEHGPRMFSLAEDLPALERAVADAGNVRLVVIDPVAAFVGRTDDHRNSEIRGLLAPLAALAGRHRLAVLAVSHLNKSGGGRALYRTMGSLAYMAAARAAWLAVRDGNDPTRRLLLPTKMNLAGEPTGLAYRVRPSADNPAVPVVAWEDGPVTTTADDALANDGADREDGRELSAAMTWLREELAGGPVPAKQVFADAAANGFKGTSTLKRAKRALGVVSQKAAFGGEWTWRLP